MYNSLTECTCITEQIINSNTNCMRTGCESKVRKVYVSDRVRQSLIVFPSLSFFTILFYSDLWIVFTKIAFLINVSSRAFRIFRHTDRKNIMKFKACGENEMITDVGIVGRDIVGLDKREVTTTCHECCNGELCNKDICAFEPCMYIKPSSLSYKPIVCMQKVLNYLSKNGSQFLRQNL